MLRRSIGATARSGAVGVSISNAPDTGPGGGRRRRNKSAVREAVAALSFLLAAATTFVVLLPAPPVGGDEFRTLPRPTASEAGVRHASSKAVAASDGATETESSPPPEEDRAAARVFIGIKTGDPTGPRFPQIRRTWLRDVLEEDLSSGLGGGGGAGVIDIEFFTTDVDASAIKSMDGWGYNVRSLFVTTNCTRKIDLICATGAMYRYYLTHHGGGNGTYFCSFDNDQYVLVRNLLRVLDEYDRSEPWRGQNVYVGRQSLPRGIKYHAIAEPVRFLTGGAGYCLSSDVVERGRLLFLDLGAMWRGVSRVRNVGEDVAVGYVATQKLGVNVTEDGHFHSHYDGKVRQRMLLKDVARQVSFGFNTKGMNSTAAIRSHRESMPNVPVKFSDAEDPMLFQSLRCFLVKEQTGWDANECA